MRSFKYAFLLVIFVSALLVSCSKDDDNPVSDVGGQKPWVALTGSWDISSDMPTISSDITATDKTVTSGGETFTGKWSGTTFNGSFSVSQNGITGKSELVLKFKSPTSIEGSVTLKMAGVTVTTNNFTGSKASVAN